MSRRAWPAVVFLLHSAPRTVRELHGLAGGDRQAIRNAVAALVEEGLVERAPGGRREAATGKPSRIWQWVPKEAAA